MGYGPGVALYTVFGIMSYYSGWIIWKVFLGLDSDRYPLRGYGDLYDRVFGSVARRLINCAQGLQLFLLVAVLILSCGQAIAQIAAGPSGETAICFITCLLIFTAAGFVLGQIRTLRRFGWIATACVYLQLLVIFIVYVSSLLRALTRPIVRVPANQDRMGVVANSPPNFTAMVASFGEAFSEGPIRTFAGTPPEGLASGGAGFVGSLNGLNQAVYSYGGCLVFAAFLAEMRHPHDFWRSLLLAQLFIYVVYIFFGVFVYSYQGQYTFIPVTQGLSVYAWQTATNVISLVGALIAASLYGNIGLKVLYIELLQGVLGAPPLTAARGKWLWVVLVPAYWALAFVLAAAVPQFAYVSGLVGALFILSFTYTLPALLAVGYWVRRDAVVEGERFDPATRSFHRTDTGVRRWVRGYMRRPLFNTWNLLYFFGGLATTALGVYSSVEQLMHAFDGVSAATSFGCEPPV